MDAMAQAGDLGEPTKHMHISARRRRFDAEAKYGGHGGRSLVKVQPTKRLEGLEGMIDAHLKISRPKDEDGNALVTEIDQALDIVPAAESGDIHAFAAGRIHELAELLSSASVVTRERLHKKLHDVVLTTYSVPGTGWMSRNAEEQRRLEQQRRARLSLAVHEGRRVFCTFRDTPLDKISEPTLLDGTAKLRSHGATWACKPERAVVFAESCEHCFSANSDDAYLEVDLGAMCIVTHVSTQGRFPPTSGTCKETGMRKVKAGDPKMNNWVTSYELSFRVESGHSWVSLGALKGNSDMTTEVAHDLGDVAKAPIHCRYLRFRPLTCNNEPALRVGVYGRKQENGACSKAAASGAEFVEYTVSHRRPRNRRRVPFAGSCGLGCAKCSKSRGICMPDPATGPKSRRRRLVAAVAQDMREVESIDDCLTCPKGEYEAYDWRFFPCPSFDAADLYTYSPEERARFYRHKATPSSVSAALLAKAEAPSTAFRTSFRNIGFDCRGFFRSPIAVKFDMRFSEDHAAEAQLARSTSSSSSAASTAMLIACVSERPADGGADEWLVIG